MNCVKGDLAVVVRSGAGNEGVILRCLEFVGEVPGWEGSDNWRTDRKTKGFFGTENNLMRDSQLRPIRGDQGNESWFKAAPMKYAKPKKVTA